MKRFLFVALALGASVLPAMAGPRDDVLYGISRCGGIADDRTWLDCVYGAAQPMRAQLGLQPALFVDQHLEEVVDLGGCGRRLGVTVLAMFRYRRRRVGNLKVHFLGLI